MKKKILHSIEPRDDVSLMFAFWSINEHKFVVDLIFFI